MSSKNLLNEINSDLRLFEKSRDSYKKKVKKLNSLFKLKNPLITSLLPTYIVGDYKNTNKKIMSVSFKSRICKKI